MNRSLSIAMLGTRGIPNGYGGFEQCAERLSVYLTAKGHKVTVYSSSSHQYQKKHWNGVEIIHQKDPEDSLGTFGQFIYDFNCIRHARKMNYDVIIQFGYTSSSVWTWMWPQVPHIVNMDGLEHQRSKYSPSVKRFLKHAEKWAAHSADLMVADNLAILSYLKDRFPTIPITFIPYGAESDVRHDDSILQSWNLRPYEYDLVICRMEPENHVKEIIEARLKSNVSRPLVLVGGNQKGYGLGLKNKYQSDDIHFIGGVYDDLKINTLRSFCHHYIHGHSVGGTNPSLLEAMSCCGSIISHDNAFNKNVLSDEGQYFKSISDLTGLFDLSPKDETRKTRLSKQRLNLEHNYKWSAIADSYEEACYGVVSS